MDLRQLERALAAFAVLDPAAIPLHHAQVFVVVASRGNPTYGEIEEALNLTNSSVSRTVNALGTTHRKGYNGLGLLETYADPDDRRRFKVRLTAKGKALQRQIEMA